MNSNWERVFNMSFAGVYPHYVAKAEKKGRTKDELHEVIRWLTGVVRTGSGSDWVLELKVSINVE